MAQISKSVVTLRIIGDRLIPSKVTKMLGCKSSFEQEKGQVLINEKTGKKRIAKFGIWALKTFDYEPENIEKQVFDILNKLTDDNEVWKNLSSDFEVEIFCGIFMKYENEGMEIPPLIMKVLGEREITLSFDIYGGKDEEE